jgi:1,4-alpha-glucan branching enzyme
VKQGAKTAVAALEAPAANTERTDHAAPEHPVADAMAHTTIAPASLATAVETSVEAPAAAYVTDVAARPLHLADRVIDALTTGVLRDPHAVLGAHLTSHDGTLGMVIRALVPQASAVEAVLTNGSVFALSPVRDGLWHCFLPGADHTIDYRLRITRGDAQTEQADGYRFLPTIGELDRHLFNEGRHLRLWEKFGANVLTLGAVTGTSFVVWAPSAAGVRVTGSFTGWESGRYPMRALGTSGVWELFIPDVGEGALYKFEIITAQGAQRIKTDPIAKFMEQPPGNASVVMAPSTYRWGDDAWIAARAARDPRTEPMIAYEVHLGSWARVPTEGDRPLTYREIAQPLADHVKRLGFTHVELMPIMEHPYGGSWGYQVSGYYAPTSRYGTPDDFRFLVDTLHRNGIGVLLDWVPAHFPKDDWALRRFDGTAMYEHEDPRLGDHPEWGTHIFNYGRHEVRNFLLANVLYWIEEFHIDGIRVDAVASMLYLDYGREAGQWLRNRLGGRENLEAIAFLRSLNHTIQSLHPGVSTIAEESTTWPQVTHPIRDGGLGFTLKWNMGWMHDTLDYFRVDPFFRKGAHDKLTFAMMYEYSERFVNPLSHDEVVHMKRSLLEKMPGDYWQKFANLRALFGYQITRPGKTLLFMGSELAPHREWNHDTSLDWHLLQDPRRQGLMAWLSALGELYQAHPAFWRRDHEPNGFQWIDVGDKEQSVLSYVRRDNERHAMVVLNLTPVAREGYRIGAPAAGAYTVALSSDEARFGGSGLSAGDRMETHPESWHGFEQSVTLTLPPLSCVVLLPDEAAMATTERARLADAATMAADARVSVDEDTPVPTPRAPRAGKPAKKRSRDA